MSKLVKGGAILLALGATAAHCEPADIQVGIEVKRDTIRFKDEEDSDGGHYKSVGGNLKFELSDQDFFVALDNRGSLLLKKKDDMKKAAFLENVAIAGPNLQAGYFVLTPYAGIGMTNTSLTGIEDGDRQKITKRSFFIPIGAMISFQYGETTIRPSVEYDFIFRSSYKVAGMSSEAPKIPMEGKMKQKGNGIKGKVEFRTGDLSITPFVSFWREKAKMAHVNYPGTGVSASAPTRHLWKPQEVGVRVAYHF